MRISEETLRYWSLFGYRLGRMEFIWSRSIPETAQEFDKALGEILFMIDDDLNPSQESYKDFTSQILLYYMKKDLTIYSSILIGICLQRYQLSIAVSGDSRREIRDLAKSSLEGIPGNLVPDKDFLFSAIVSCKDSDLSYACSRILEAIDIMFESNTASNDNVLNDYVDGKQYVFISYSTKDMEYVEIIKNRLSENNIRIWIAPDSIPAGSEYTETIVDAIENSTVVLLVLSENSQESVWVPKELDIALSSEKHIIPIRIDKSELNNKMRFRLSNAQIEDASEALDQKLSGITDVIKRIIKT